MEAELVSLASEAHDGDLECQSPLSSSRHQDSDVAGLSGTSVTRSEAL